MLTRGRSKLRWLSATRRADRYRRWAVMRLRIGRRNRLNRPKGRAKNGHDRESAMREAARGGRDLRAQWGVGVDASCGFGSLAIQPVESCRCRNRLSVNQSADTSTICRARWSTSAAKKRQVPNGGANTGPGTDSTAIKQEGHLRALKNNNRGQLVASVSFTQASTTTASPSTQLVRRVQRDRRKSALERWHRL